jgi:multiple antibiotic resistance protein
VAELELGLRAFAMFFATIGPIDGAALFASLTAGASEHQRRATAIRGMLIATFVLVVFALFGGSFLGLLGIGVPALQTSGGILLLLMAIEMVFARPSAIAQPTPAETAEAEVRADLSVFPLAMPLIAGPGALAAAVLLMSEAGDPWARRTAVIVALLAVLALTLGALLVASRLQRRLGLTGQTVIARLAGILLAALAVQFMFDGVAASGLLRG